MISQCDQDSEMPPPKRQRSKNEDWSEDAIPPSVGESIGTSVPVAPEVDNWVQCELCDVWRRIPNDYNVLCPLEIS